MAETAPKHYNVRVEVEEVTEANVKMDQYGNVKESTERRVLELVSFKTQRTTAQSAARAATAAINLMMDDRQGGA